MPPTPTSPPQPVRRRLLLGALSGLTLAACGGGGGGGQDGGGDGGGGGAPPPTDGNAGPSGRLVFANSSQVATWRFGVGEEAVFDTGSTSSLSQGASVSPDGQLVLAYDLDNTRLQLDVVDLTGRLAQRVTLNHALAFFTSGVIFDATGTRLAFGIDEYVAAVDDRVARVLVHRWPDGALLASLDGYDQPEWNAATGELVLRSEADQSLHRFDTDLRYVGPLDGLVAMPQNASFSLSRDGRYVLLEDGFRIRVHDRQGGPGWVAVERASNVHAPRLSPDGRWLAFHGIDLKSASRYFHTYVPHIVPFAPGLTVQVDLDTPTLSSLAFTGYTMSWLA